MTLWPAPPYHGRAAFGLEAALVGSGVHSRPPHSPARRGLLPLAHGHAGWVTPVTHLLPPNPTPSGTLAPFQWRGEVPGRDSLLPHVSTQPLSPPEFWPTRALTGYGVSCQNTEDLLYL